MYNTHENYHNYCTYRLETARLIVINPLINFKALQLILRPFMRSVMPPIITGRDLNEHECECDWVFWGSSSLSSPHLFICKNWGGSGVIGGCGGTWASTSSYPVFPLSLNVVNECASKASCRHFAGSGPISPSRELLLLLLLLLLLQWAALVRASCVSVPCFWSVNKPVFCQWTICPVLHPAWLFFQSGSLSHIIFYKFCLPKSFFSSFHFPCFWD